MIGLKKIPGLATVAGLLVLGLALGLAGCGGKTPEKTPEKPPEKVKTNRDVLVQLGADLTDDSILAVILNEPTQAQMENFGHISKVVHQQDGEKMLFVPVNSNTSLRLETVVWSNASQSFQPGHSLYALEKTADGDALLLQALRSEGIPELRFLVAYGKTAGEYEVSYNGKDGTANLEYVKATKAGLAAWTGQSLASLSSEGEAGDSTGNQGLPKDQPSSVGTGEGQTRERKNLKFNEMSAVFQMSEDNITALYGEPVERRREELFEGMDALNLYYKGTSFALDRDGKGTVYLATIADDKVQAPRSIKIGDGLEQVLAQFPDNGQAGVLSDPLEEDRQYRMLYGENEYMTEYGLVEYKGKEVLDAIFATQEGALLTFNFQGGKVTSVSYEIPLT